MKSMASAPTDRRILLLCKITQYKNNGWVQISERWQECFWHPGSGLWDPCWMRWCGAENIFSTENIMPLGWAELPK